MAKLFRRFAAVCIALGFTVIPIAAQSSVGYVVGIKGVWILNGSITLSVATELPAGGSIRHHSSSSDDYITIVDMRAKPLPSLSRNCGNGNCAGAINLPRTPQSNILSDAIGAVFGAVAKTVRESPRRRRSVESRGGEISAAAAVVKLTEDRIDLSSVLKPQGELYLRWHVISQADENPPEWTKPIRLDQSAVFFGFQPGLYEIGLMRSNGTNFETLAAAWILVATSPNYERQLASFQEMLDVIKSWGDTVKPEAKLVFLQAALENLARETNK